MPKERFSQILLKVSRGELLNSVCRRQAVAHIRDHMRHFE